MRIGAVIFDLDGTLVDSSPDIAFALNRAFVGLGCRELLPGEVLRLLGGGPKALVLSALQLLEVELSEQHIEQILELYLTEYASNATRNTTFFADAAEVLPLLRQRGIMLGICTNKRTAIAQRVLSHLRVGELFGAVVGGDIVPYPKPDPSHLLTTLSSLGIGRDECLYVGDTDIDARTAEEAEIRYAHVAWGERIQRTKLLEIHHFVELLPYLTD